MITSRQTCRHEAVHHNQSRLNISDNVDNRGKEVDHLASRIRHVDRSSIFNGFASVAKARRPDEGEGEGRAVLLAGEVVFHRLSQGQAVDLVIGSTCRNLIVKTGRSSEVDFDGDVCIADRLGGSEEDVELARLDVGDEKYSLWSGVSHCERRGLEREEKEEEEEEEREEEGRIRRKDRR